MTKALNKKLFRNLKSGVLRPLLTAVQHDDTLHMELCGDSVDIYYRGGLLYHVTEQDKIYTVEFNPEYCVCSPVIGSPNMLNAAYLIPQYKQKMDEYFRENPDFLRELQQSMIRANNRSFRLSSSSDYYILDDVEG